MKKIKIYISNWIKDYAKKNKKTSLIIGISGGIDSAVTSTLCAETNINTIVVSMPINQNTEELSSNEQEFLEEIFDQIILDIFIKNG